MSFLVHKQSWNLCKSFLFEVNENMVFYIGLILTKSWESLFEVQNTTSFTLRYVSGKDKNEVIMQKFENAHKLSFFREKCKKYNDINPINRMFDGLKAKMQKDKNKITF